MASLQLYSLIFLGLYHVSSMYPVSQKFRQKRAVFDTIPVNIPLNLIEKENVPSFYGEVLHQQDSHTQNQYLQKQQNRKDRALKLRTHFQQMEIKDYMKNFLKKQEVLESIARGPESIVFARIAICDEIQLSDLLDKV